MQITHYINPSTLNTIKVFHPPQMAPTNPQTTGFAPITATPAPDPYLGTSQNGE
jgi:hypothetical protein